MKYSRHRFGPECRGCVDRLALGHPDVVAAFSFIKAKFPDVHVSWVYRGEEDQEKARSSGASNAKFGQSKHNKTPAEAFDIFQQDASGNGIFDPKFCTALNKELKAAGFKLKWGGEFKNLGDYCHWETL